MDNFPFPEGSHKLDVPYLSQAYPHLEYDGKGWDDFPRRKGWSIEAMLAGDIQQEHNKEESAAFLQSWLFFGFLADWFAIPYNEDGQLHRCGLTQPSWSSLSKFQSYFLCPSLGNLRLSDDERLFCSIENAGRLSWQARQAFLAFAKDNDLDFQTQVIRNKAGMLDRHTLYYNQFLRGSGSNSLLHVLPPTARLSISNLSHTVKASIRGIFLEHAGKFLGGMTQNVQEDYEIIRRRFEDGGWCQAEYTFQLQGWSTRYLFYLSCLSRIKRVDHTHCSDTVCIHSVVREENYVIRHTTDGCQCEMIDLTKEVEAHFCEGSTSEVTRQFPLIQCEDAVDGQRPRVQIVTSQNRPYIAISHVWSEGLGNPKGNALPTCQILQLQNFASEAYNIMRKKRKENTGKKDDIDSTSKDDNKELRIAFWIDTICVPLSSAQRKKAILEMLEVYEQAEAVVVVEYEMLARKLGDQYNIEFVLACLTASKWYRRLWTLQEGLAAKEVLFIFADNFVRLGWLHEFVQDRLCSDKAPATKVEDHETYRDMLLAGGLAIEPHTLYTPFYDYWHQRGHASPDWDRQTRRIWSLLPFRSTTKAGDEAICLSNVLGLDASAKLRIIDCLPEKRMSLLWRSMAGKSIPQSILLNYLPKVEERGMRWAPKSIVWTGIDTSGIFVDIRSQLLPVTPEGLVCKAPGIILQRLPHPLTIPFYIRIVGNEQQPQWMRASTGRSLPVEWFTKLAPRLTNAALDIESKIPLILVIGGMVQSGIDCVAVLGVADTEDQVPRTFEILSVVTLRAMSQNYGGEEASNHYSNEILERFRLDETEGRRHAHLTNENTVVRTTVDATGWAEVLDWLIV